MNRVSKTIISIFVPLLIIYPVSRIEIRTGVSELEKNVVTWTPAHLYEVLEFWYLCAISTTIYLLLLWRLKRVLLMFVLLGTSYILGAMVVTSVRTNESGDGSPRYAQKWMNRLAAIQSPDDLRRILWVVQRHTFADGTWIWVSMEGSHGNANGGTIVTRDSQGQVRAFFGHVCMSSLAWAMTETGNPQTLREFYDGLAKHKFTEYKQDKDSQQPAGG